MDSKNCLAGLDVPEPKQILPAGPNDAKSYLVTMNGRAIRKLAARDVAANRKLRAQCPEAFVSERYAVVEVSRMAGFTYSLKDDGPNVVVIAESSL